MLAKVLIDLLALVKAGFEFKAIVEEVKEMYNRGATDKEVSAWIRSLRNEALDDLGDELKND